MAALELRKAGAPYREIARQLGNNVHTAHADIAAELSVLRETAGERAGALRDLELERCDAMTAGLWPRIHDGHPPAVVAGVRVAERRARLLGLDEPIATKTELSASLSVTAQQYAAERELFLSLPVEQLEALAAESQALVDKAFAMARAHGVKLDASPARGAPVECGDGRDAPCPNGIGADALGSGNGDRALDQDCGEASALPVSGSSSRTAAVEDVGTGAPAEPSTPPAVTDQREAARAETAPPDTH